MLQIEQPPASSISRFNELRSPIFATISYAVVSLTFRFSPIIVALPLKMPTSPSKAPPKDD